MDWWTKDVQERVRAACLGRSGESISKIAQDIGVSRSTLARKMAAEKLKAKARFATRPVDLDFQIQKTIETGGTLSGLARRLSLPLSTIHSRAMRKGWLRQPKKIPWTPAEDEYLRELPLCVPAKLAKEWPARFNVTRTPEAISQRIRLLQGTTDVNYPWYRSSQVAELLGISKETVLNWIKGGLLKAQRDGSDRNTWIVHQNWLRLAFIYHKVSVDLRRIPPANQTWFVDLIADPVNGHRTDHKKSEG